MARPREFDESAVIDRAMQQFWAHGYEATSVDDLCAVTGLNRSSLYRAFGSKRDLLDIALTAYEESALNGIERLFAQHPIDEGRGCSSRGSLANARMRSRGGVA